MSLFKKAEGQLQTFCSLDCKFLGLGEEEKILRAELQANRILLSHGLWLDSNPYRCDTNSLDKYQQDY